MKFEMTAPCPKCPFRTDVKPYLTRARAKEIADSIVQQQQTFPCHVTTEHDDDGEVCGPTGSEQHCAGALILLEHANRPNQMMRISERLGVYNRRALDMDAPVFRTARDFITAQPTRRR